MQDRWNGHGLAFTLGLLAAIWGVDVSAAEESSAAKVEFFEKQVRPIFVSHCYACHSADTKPAGDLRVDDRHGLIVGGDHGPAIVPGSPDASLLIKRVTQQGAKRMPLEGEYLTDVQVNTLRTWIDDGAAWPVVKLPDSFGRPKPEYDRLRREHWAWQPCAAAPAPDVDDGDWPISKIDRFVLAKLEARGLKPVGDADKATLLRRITFDLTGLPPAPLEIDNFLADQRSNAFEVVVDRLLASPHFGERWGRYWLDVARYGESTGPSRNIPYPHAWRYRDYVIDAFNADVPFNRFVQEQIAGDLLPAATTDERDRLNIATGFLALGVKDVNQRFKVRFEMDNIDEQIDVVTRSVLGLTVSCARCHDHKFDPVPSTDYYALAGIFASTENAAGVRNKMGGGGLDYFNPQALIRLEASGSSVADPEQMAKLSAEVARAKQEWEKIRGTPEGLKKQPNGQPFQRQFRLKYERLQAQLNKLNGDDSHALVAHGVRESIRIADAELRIRGEAEHRGPLVPRGFLSVVEVPNAAHISPDQSGRLELAKWLTSDRNALAQRVIVNRIWQQLFGRGIVSTVDNFGAMGDTPSHPELLDYLAADFVAEGWSVKKTIRQIALSRSYQLSADATKENVTVDPANTLLWRHSPRRLSAEELRDGMLAAADALDPQRPQGSPAQSLPMVEMPDNGREAKAIHEAASAANYRSIYLPQLRGLTPKTLEAFDPVDPTLVSGSRAVTTVPTQALYLLNSPFVRKQSLAIAAILERSASTRDADRIREAYRRVLGRDAASHEIERARAFVEEFAAQFVDRPEVIADATPTGDATTETSEVPPPDNPDELDQTGVPYREETVKTKGAREAAWLALVQALFATAEFRYLR